jgi:hypothetical protein
MIATMAFPFTALAGTGWVSGRTVKTGRGHLLAPHCANKAGLANVGRTLCVAAEQLFEIRILGELHGNYRRDPSISEHCCRA